MDQPFIGAYWRSRQESRSQCAERYAKLLERLRAYPHLSQWFFQGNSAKSSRRPVPTLPEDLARHLGTNNGDFDRAPIVELGFNLAIWNGASDEEAALLSVDCGGFNIRTPNNVILDMPECKQPVTSFLDEYRSLLKAIIDCFDPEEAVVTSHERMETYTRETWRQNGYLNYKRGGEITEGGPD